MKNIRVTLPDGSVRSYEGSVTAQQVAKDIGKRLEQAAVAAKVNGSVVDLTKPIDADATIAIITRDSAEGLEVIRHSTAHLLAMAVKAMYPGTQITIGPVIEDGFYYDIDSPHQLTPDDLPKIEKKMEEIAAQKLDVHRKELPPAEMIKLFEGIGDHYKVELIQGFPKGEPVSAYEQGGFIDLCRGPHVPNTERLGKFKLLSIAGAYWRGDERNKMLQRIYGTAWANKEDLQAYLTRIEEAKKRDHRKLGPELELFTFLPDVAPAMPFYLPKGTTLYNTLLDFMRPRLKEWGYQEVICPQLMTTQLWKTSGHMDNYTDNMFFIDEEHEHVMAVKPMNCPGHITLFGNTKRSYRDLPIRYAEFSRLHRLERGGVTHGILRTRSFAQDDGHVFCTPDQIEQESAAIIKSIFDVYKIFGFDQIDLKLADRPEKHAGSPESYDRATQALAEGLKKMGHPFSWAKGEGAFYGPKIEFHMRDSIGRYWQCGTLQLDFVLPERFGLEYTDSDGQPKRPVMIHRAVWGSIERFLGILVEHYAGHFPLWLSPTQVVVINVTDDQRAYAQTVLEHLQKLGMRVELDARYEKLGYRIRDAQVKKTPLMIVLGDKEVQAKTISVRKHTGETTNDLTLKTFEDLIKPQLQIGGINH